MEAINGEIQYIKPDRKSFAILDVWYNNKFKTLPDGIVKGSKAQVDYIIKNEKNYWQSVRLAVPNPIGPIVENYKLAKENLLNNTKENLTPTDKNCILMTSMNLYLSVDNSNTFEQCIKEVKELRLKI